MEVKMSAQGRALALDEEKAEAHRARGQIAFSHSQGVKYKHFATAVGASY